MSTGDAGAFLSRLTRLDPGALVRLHPTAGGTQLCAVLPWDVLVTRTVADRLAVEDVTVGAAAMLAALPAGAKLPPARDAEWRWPLPSSPGDVVESVPADVLRRIGSAAADTLREAASAGVGGRRVGERALRDALLDHVAIVVSPEHGGDPVRVPQRLIQAVLRMGFLGSDAEAPVRVRRASGWIALAAPFGSAWLRTVSALAIHPLV